MEEAKLVLIGTLGGAALGVISTIFITWIKEHYREKDRKRKIVFETALQDWTAKKDLAFQKMEKDGKPFTLQPFEAFLISNIKMTEVLFNKEINPEELQKALSESRKLIKVLNESEEN